MPDKRLRVTVTDDETGDELDSMTFTVSTTQTIHVEAAGLDVGGYGEAGYGATGYGGV